MQSKSKSNEKESRFMALFFCIFTAKILVTFDCFCNGIKLFGISEKVLFL